MPIYNETKLECMYETNELKMYTTGVPTLKKVCTLPAKLQLPLNAASGDCFDSMCLTEAFRLQPAKVKKMEKNQQSKKVQKYH